MRGTVTKISLLVGFPLHRLAGPDRPFSFLVLGLTLRLSQFVDSLLAQTQRGVPVAVGQKQRALLVVIGLTFSFLRVVLTLVASILP